MSERNLSVSLRPSKLDEVLGNSSVVSAIRTKLASGVVPTAWMFSGPPGVGKTTLALIIANAVQDGAAADAADVTEVNASDTNGVDDIRELVRQAAYAPMEGRYKVIVLDESHRLTEPAQNVLLKPFEDKDSTTIWVICTTEPAKIIPALRSRCLSFALKGLSPAERIALVDRAAPDTDVHELIFALSAAEVTSPRDVLMAVEKFLAGMPAEEAARVSGGEHDPLYRDIARSVCNGNWNATRAALSKLKAADVRGLRACIAAYLRGMLLDADGEVAVRLSDCLIGLIQVGAVFEDGLALSGTVAACFRICRKLGR